MKNLKYLACREINEFDTIVAGKSDLIRLLLVPIRNRVNRNYVNYLTNFQTIQNLRANSFNQFESDALRHMYSPKTKAKSQLIANIINSQTDIYQTLCGYCMLDPRRTIDHYIPQEEYPVFSTMVKNLIPCCHQCNGKKSRIWRNGNQRIFLHLINDRLPSSQFLFGQLSFTARGVPVINFNLKRGRIPRRKFAIIDSHFSHLELVERYSQEGTTALISEINIDVKTYRSTQGNLAIGNLSSYLLNKSKAYKHVYGNNYWKSIALDLLGNSNQFLASL